jgi:hypothetical protein
VLDSQLVLSNLELHLRLVLLQVGESLLQINVFLSLGGHRLIKELRIVLDHGHNLLQIIVVKSFKVSLHRGDFRSVGFDQFLILHEVHLGTP